ncbi:MAG: hypothetical protein USCGTAYLOR_01396 [Chromatiales bacterium USCg_Taylor]|nr:MAG: hypothetical protein USCGTAYLOR_01396 [Chromatiales bacterium USCg_Taylor]
MDFLSEYGLFSAKLITVLVLLIGQSSESRGTPGGQVP